QYEKKPRYIVFAGLVFQPLDTNLFATAKFDDVNVRRLYADYVPKGLFMKQEDIVVLTRVENDAINSQLGDFTGQAVEKINGTVVTSLKQVNELLHPQEMPEFFVIELYGGGRPIVIPGKEVQAADKRVRETYSIARPANLEE
ncbi:MAG: 2-alkenal reductase, partial [Akkermansiaceae bacterium]|nr:2-alkenal reductase [Akkermansiaceae bacterium]